MLRLRSHMKGSLHFRGQEAQRQQQRDQSPRRWGDFRKVQVSPDTRRLHAKLQRPFTNMKCPTENRDGGSPDLLPSTDKVIGTVALGRNSLGLTGAWPVAWLADSCSLVVKCSVPGVLLPEFKCCPC